MRKRKTLREKDKGRKRERLERKRVREIHFAKRHGADVSTSS